MAVFMRKRIRLKNYDYSADGAYFITICTAGRRCVLGTINEDTYGLELSEYGKKVQRSILNLPMVFPGICIPVYIVMPNHVHMIIEVKNQQKTISNIVNYFKGNVTRNTFTGIWQKSFYEHIIRNERDYNEIVEYIMLNPRKWATDKYYSDNRLI